MKARGLTLHDTQAPEIPRHQGPGVLKIGVVHKEERDLRTGLGFRV